jgi:hypothetical protein
MSERTLINFEVRRERMMELKRVAVELSGYPVVLFILEYECFDLFHSRDFLTIELIYLNVYCAGLDCARLSLACLACLGIILNVLYCIVLKVIRRMCVIVCVIVYDSCLK